MDKNSLNPSHEPIQDGSGSSLEDLLSNGHAAWNADHRQEAVRMFSDIPRLIPGSDYVAATVAEALAALGDLKSARELLEDWLERNDGPWSRRQLGLIVQLDGDPERALHIFEALCVRFPDSPAGFTGRLDILSTFGHKVELERRLVEAMTAFPQDKWIWHMAANAAEERRDYGEALRIWREILRFSPEHLPAAGGVVAMEAKLIPPNLLRPPVPRVLTPLERRISSVSSDIVPQRAVVISNCQSLPIASWLTTFSSSTHFDFFGVHLIDPDKRSQEVEQFVVRAKAEFDLVISLPLSEEFSLLSSSRIKDTFDSIPVVSISNIYFAGLHPDLTYIGSLGRRVNGPMGDYHSRVALFSYLVGMSLDECEAMFCDTVYETIGYYDQFATSMEELATRDGDVEVSVAPVLEKLLRSELCFYSVNHPTSNLFARYSQEISDHLSTRGLGRLSGVPAHPAMCGETLASSYIYPIYPEIAARQGVEQFGSYAFKPLGSRVNPLDLRQFIELEFKAFEEFGRDAMAECYEGQIEMARFKRYL